MRLRYSILPIIAVLSLCACSQQIVKPEPSAGLCRTEAYFSRQAAPALIDVLDDARSSIRVAIYGLTNRRIVDALVAAKRRGVYVEVKTDKTESEGRNQTAMIAKLRDAGVPVEVSTQARHLHHKFAVIDAKRVVTGSFNYTENADRRNRENIVILDCPEMAQAFSAEWNSIRPDAP